MPIIADYLKYAETAFAAYASNLLLGTGVNARAYEDAKMSSPQAQRFDAAWQVLGQQDLWDGFSAVLFQPVDSQGNPVGQKVLAIRGTEGSHWGIDFLVDVVNIALLGTNVGMRQYASLESFYQSLIANKALSATESIVTTGHSLGGFLAQAFASQHGTVSAAYTYNAPGFTATTGLPNISTELLKFFGLSGTVPNDKIFNARALDGISATAGLGQMIGAVQTFNIEGTANPVSNHSIATLTDALAVYGLYARVDASVSPERVGSLLKASSSNSIDTLESATKALGKIFVGSEATIPVDNRDDLYRALYALRSNDTFKSLAGQARIEFLGGKSATAFANLARTDTNAIAYRYALKELNPFALLGFDYSQHNQNGELDLVDPATGEGELTDRYLAERARMLTYWLQSNLTDGQRNVDKTLTTDRSYEDIARNITLLVDHGTNTSTADMPKQKYIFGGAGNDTSFGGDDKDVLFGGAGMDRLDGGKGDDYLEGNAGSDILSGGTGRDTLVGGAGSDSYIYTRGDGSEMIDDADGQGTITVDGTALDGGQKLLANLWQSNDENTKYALFDDADGTQTLNIYLGGERLYVKNFSNGELGITLEDAPPLPAPTLDRSIRGDLAPADVDPVTDGVQTGVDDLGNLITDPSRADPDRIDFLYDSAGNDDIRSGGGHDYVWALQGGDDRIDLGDGHDFLWAAGAGNDIGIGSEGADALIGDADADTLYAGNEVSLDDALARQDDAASPQRELVDGRDGDDTLIGDTGKDALIGGAGDDLIIGGAGDDDIDGDLLIVDSIFFNWGVHRSIVNDGNTYQTEYTGMEFVLPTVGGNDIIYAGGGVDWVRARQGNDWVDGGAGDDIVFGEAGNDDLFGGDGADRLWGDTDTEDGGNDYLDGEAGDDRLYGNGGNDQLFGGDDADWLQGDDNTGGDDGGDDYLDGEAGADTLYGMSGNDTLFGGSGADLLVGDNGNGVGSGNDYLDGEVGDDQLYGNAGNDTLYGGDGGDWLQGDNAGGVGSDVLDGEGGNDTLLGMGGADSLFGGDGDDRLNGDSSNGGGDGDDYVDGQAGADTLWGNGGGDTLIGGADADKLFGNTGADQLSGDSGADRLNGGDGDDRLDGGSEADALFGQAGNDTLAGGDGADWLQGDNGDGIGDGDDHVDGGAGADVLFGEGGHDMVSGAADTDELQGGDGNDRLDGGGAADVLYGDAGDDILLGSDGDDILLGGDGNDTLDGGAGNDVYFVSGSEGIDRIVDSGGTDWLVLTDALSGQVVLGVGSLKLTLPGGGEVHLDDFDPDRPLDGAIEYFQFADNTVMTRQQLIQTLGFRIDGTPGDDVLSGTAFAEPINALAGNDHVDGRGGNDSIALGDGDDVGDGGTGDDTVQAGAGHDVVRGGAGADRLFGGDGDDTLAGGAGNDTLDGGSGNDTFRFGPGDGQDVVTDTAGGNTVRLEGGLVPEQIVLRRLADDLVVSLVGGPDQLSVRGWFSAAGSGWTLQFDDGRRLDRAAVDDRLQRNQAPVLAEDALSVAEDGLLQAGGNALANDADPEGRALRLTTPGETGGSYGTLSLAADGAFSYRLDNTRPAVQALAAGEQATDRFAYTATDDDPAGAASSSAAIVVTIAGANDAPVASDDFGQLAEDGIQLAAGNVLANDCDIDNGTVLRVAAPGTTTTAYGTLTLAADGAYTYTLANSAPAVQGLGRSQAVSERLAYAADDGQARSAATLVISIAGTNDAPIVAAPLADQTASPNKAWTWTLPAGSFSDTDQGDVLDLDARLADGTALPSWLVFEAATQTFSGRVPRTATGFVDIEVTATDRVATTGSTQGSLAAHDVFRLDFGSGSSGGGGGSGGSGGGGSQGNEGVGNGVDAPPPGQDANFNDGPGSSPGAPGAKGGHRPPARHTPVRADPDMAVPAKTLAGDVPADAQATASARHDQTGTTSGDTDHGRPPLGAGPQALDYAPASAPAAAAGADSGGAIGALDLAPPDLTAYLAAINGGNAPGYVSVAAETDDARVFADWLAVDLALAEARAADRTRSGFEAARAADTAALAMLRATDPGAGARFGDDAWSLLAGSGRLKPFTGFGQGAEKII